MNHSFPLGYSPYPPVAVYGTGPTKRTLEVFLERLFDRVARVKTRTAVYIARLAMKGRTPDLPGTRRWTHTMPNH